MELKKTTLHLREQRARQTFHVCVEGDVVVPDGKPDILEVLVTDAKATVHATECKNGQLTVSGAVPVQILYCPEGEDAVTVLDTAFPFSESVSAALTEDCSVLVTAETEHISFRPVNSRKLSVKVIASLTVLGNAEKELLPITEIALPRVQCKTRPVQLYSHSAHCGVTLTVSDLLTVPKELPDIDTLLKVEAQGIFESAKVMNGKVMIKGTANVSSLYTGTDGQLICVSHKIPFTEVAEAAGIEEGDLLSVSFGCCTVTTAVRGDLNGDTKIISAEITMPAVICGGRQESLTMIEDCFTTDGTLSPKRERAVLEELVLNETALQPLTQAVKGKIKRIIQTSAKCILREASVQQKTLQLRGALVSFLLYEGENGIKCAVTETEFTHTKAISGENCMSNCSVSLEEVHASLQTDGSAEVKAVLKLTMQVLSQSEVTFVTDCAILPKEEIEEAPLSNNSACLVIYFTREGDTLWSIAKRYRTTPEKIALANGIQENTPLSIGSKLVVPR